MSSTAQNLASSRIAALLDENSFVEIGAAVTARATDFNMNNTDTPSDGVVTGYGVINDSLVYVYSQDASVLGGSMGEMHANEDGCTGYRSYRLCRSETSGGFRCSERIW